MELGARRRARRGLHAELMGRNAAPSLAARITGNKPRAAAAVLCSAIVLMLAGWFPGDETLRALSETPLRLMISRSGFSLGAAFQHGPVKRPPKSEGVWKGPLPRYDSPMNFTAARDGPRPDCLLVVRDDRPALELMDGGVVRSVDLADTGSAPDFNEFKCTHFQAVGAGTAEEAEQSRWPIKGPERVLLLSSATNAAMLQPYQKSLRNHREYARHHGYGFTLSLVGRRALGGRSGKMAKHYALGAHAAASDFDVICHVDLDAWFASWDPISAYTRGWPPEKDLLIPDAAQLWLNSGVVCTRRSGWAAGFFARVMDALHDEGGGVAFKRDQPALWHVLFGDWAREGLVPYQGPQCSAWEASCNPDENPVECWHWCFWDTLIRTPGGWEGLHDVNRLTHLYMPPREMQPTMHRLCLRSCRSVLARGVIGACSALTGLGCGKGQGVDRMSLCDGRGCLRQLASEGGAWLKHTGHQHWRDPVPECMPLSKDEADEQLERVAC